MLTINYRYGGSLTYDTLNDWVHKTKVKHSSQRGIKSVTVSGEFIKTIHDTFTHIPNWADVSNSEITYYGDMAKFIVGNL